MSNIRRINFYGAPGSGKSTLAKQICALLNREGHDAELIQEWIKKWAYEGRKPDTWDQNYIFASQMFLETDLLKRVNYTVADGSPQLCSAYARFYNCPYWEQLEEIARQQEEAFPAINFWVTRDHPYQNKGRYETEEQSNEKHVVLRQNLNEYEFIDIKSTYNPALLMENYILPNLK
jgi:adenylate kinase family enzyme